MSGIKHEYTLNAVTGLAFCRPSKDQLLVLAGEGCYLKVYEASSSKLVAQCQVFDSQTVHGIAVAERPCSSHGIEVAIWGGRAFVLLEADVLDAVVSCERVSVVEFECIAPDWIMDGAIMPSQGASVCVFATAHCALLKATLNSDSRRPGLRSLSSASQSILYSAHIVWTSTDSIMAAAGTMFGEIEIIVWQSINDEDADKSQSRHLFTFTGHEGSVFGVRISPEIIDQDGRTSRLLASCSDDRTIRIWDLSLESNGQNEGSTTGGELPFARETGFGANGDVSISESSAKRCIAVVMAHASRIWRVLFATWNKENSNTTQVCVLSFGEDSTCQYWSVDWRRDNHKKNDSVPHVVGSRETSSAEKFLAVLNHLNTFAYHTGKHIWSAALFPVSQARKCLVTGGADGKISIYDILSPQEDFSRAKSVEKFSPGLDIASSQNKQVIISRSWAIEEMFEKLPIPARLLESDPVSLETVPDDETSTVTVKKKKKKPTKIPKDFPNRYAFVSQNKLLVTTSFGRILLATIGTRVQWEELKLPGDMNGDLSSYSLLLSLPERGVAFLTGANGTLYMYSHKRPILEISKVNGKPAGLFDVSKSQEDEICILVTILGSETAYFLFVKNYSASVPAQSELVTITISNSFVVTSASNIRDLFLLGHRNGSIAVYHLPSKRDPTIIYTDRWIKNMDAITSIVSIPSKSMSEASFHCLATCRNGSYLIFSISVTSSSDENLIDHVSLILVHQAYPPFGPMIEAAWFSDADLMLYGFQSKNFIVWNETKRRTVATIECGGAHRSYAYSPGSEIGGAAYFAYTKASKLYIHSQSQPSHSVMKTGGHGREIKACALHNEFIATGAEDTTIRIWRHKTKSQDDKRASLECCAVIEKHSTGIQHLQWCCSSDDFHNLFSAGGAEEFYVWAISIIPGFGVGVVCEATLTDHSEDKDLRIMGFHAEVFYNKAPRRIGHDAITSRNHMYHISLIYSDSTIKAHRYSRQDGFTKIAEGRYTSACLSQITGIQNFGSHYFLTASTDGHLCLWSFPVLQQASATHSNDLITNTTSTSVPEFSLLFRFRIHQSSVSALAIEHLTLILASSSQFILVATAGDDNALALTLLRSPIFGGGKPYTPTKRISIPSAHAAGITGLAFKTDMTGGMAEGQWVQLWSVGGDQRVKRWRIEILQDPAAPAHVDLKVHAVRPEDDTWTSVADPGGLVEFRRPPPRRPNGDIVWGNDDNDSYCLVVGNGMEVFKLKDGFPNGDGYAWEGITWERRGGGNELQQQEDEDEMDEAEGVGQVVDEEGFQANKAI